MTRGLHSSTIAALANDSFQMATLIQMDFSTVLRLTDWPTNVTAFAATFTASADILEVGSANETGDLRVNEFTLKLSGVSQYYLALFLGNNYVNVRTQVWKAVISSGAVVGSPIQVFDGNMTNFDIDENDTGSEVTVSIASHWKDFERVNGRRTNSASQKKWFSADEGMQFAKELVKDIPWGRK